MSRTNQSIHADSSKLDVSSRGDRHSVISEKSESLKGGGSEVEEDDDPELLAFINQDQYGLEGDLEGDEENVIHQGKTSQDILNHPVDMEKLSMLETNLGPEETEIEEEEGEVEGEMVRSIVADVDNFISDIESLLATGRSGVPAKSSTDLASGDWQAAGERASLAEEEEEVEDEIEEEVEDEILEKEDDDAWVKWLEPMEFIETVEAITQTMALKSGIELTSFTRSESICQTELEDGGMSLKSEGDISPDLGSSMRASTLKDEMQRKSVHPSAERLKLEGAYKAAWLENRHATKQNVETQNRLLRLLCTTDKEYNDYTNEQDTLQQKELYVKLFGKYVALARRWCDMEDLEKDEVIRYNSLKVEVEEALDGYIEKKVNTLLGKNRNEKSTKYQLANKLEESERKKWAEANELQVGNLAIRIQLEKLSQQLKQREVIGGNFTIMGYNQLKHDNLVAREVIAQKNEQCESVLRNMKISAQKMTHIKEKLNFVRHQYRSKVDTLYAKEKLCDQIYLELKGAKRARMKARQLLTSLQSKNDLLSYPELLMDYEAGIEKNHRLKVSLTNMTADYDSIVSTLKSLLKKLQSLS